MINSNVSLGYCCINLSLADRRVSANRGMIKKTFEQKGSAYAGELAYLNLCDLLTILEWNVENDIYVYEKINTYGQTVDIEIEAKAKDLAVLKYRENHELLLENYLDFDDKRFIKDL